MRPIIRTYFIVIVIAAACTSPLPDGHIHFTEKDLPQKQLLTGTKYNFENILNPKGIHLKNNLAVVWESKYANDKFHVIDVEREKYLQAKGIDGLGPGEITMIHSMQDPGEENKIWVYDFEQRLYSKFDLLDSSKLAEVQFRPTSKSHFIVYPVWSSDTTLLVTLADGWEKYQNIDIGGNLIFQFGSWKDNIKSKKLPRGIKEKDLDANLVNYVFQGPLVGSHAKDYFIRTGNTVDFVEIIHPKTQTVKLVFGPDLELPQFDIGYHLGYQMPEFLPPIKHSYTDAFAGKSSFFVLYLGKESSKFSESNNLNRIFEFDYEGRVLNHYQLDFPLIGFTVDEKNKRFYGISFDSEPNIVRFEY